jgi:hypothetical protein
MYHELISALPSMGLQSRPLRDLGPQVHQANLSQR